jgi:DNA repair protein RecN (Recombination protein N)
VLRRLYIRNYAIIKEVEISFTHGLSIITGETGAGKSILMGALSLVLGERADLKSLYTQDEKCIIEAEFELGALPDVHDWLRQQDLDAEKELIIRREINLNGKSRAFINDTPTTLDNLQQLSGQLIDMHRQFDTQTLQQANQHLDILDSMCQNSVLRSEYRAAYHHWKQINQELNALREKNLRLRQELDYHQFLFDELEAYAPQVGEMESMEAELFILSNSEDLKLSLQQSVFLLKEKDDAVSIQVKHVASLLQTHASRMPDLQNIVDRLQSIQIELKDITGELEAMQDAAQPDEERKQIITDRLNEGNRLLKKHNVSSNDALIAIWQQLATTLTQAQLADDNEQALQQQQDEAFDRLNDVAEQLSAQRRSSIPPIENEINALLKKVGMPNAQLQIQLQTTACYEQGKDKAEILFDANKTGRFASISKIASGGELSRLMLCIKSLTAHTVSLPNLVFDEIDTGISGETAVQVGILLRELSQRHQLICITHLPQIAGKGHQHFYIYKTSNPQGELETKLRLLTEEERVDVLAEMLGGKQNATHAREMVMQLMA